MATLLVLPCAKNTKKMLAIYGIKASVRSFKHGLHIECYSDADGLEMRRVLEDFDYVQCFYNGYSKGSPIQKNIASGRLGCIWALPK